MDTCPDVLFRVFPPRLTPLLRACQWWKRDESNEADEREERFEPRSRQCLGGDRPHGTAPTTPMRQEEEEGHCHRGSVVPCQR